MKSSGAWNEWEVRFRRVSAADPGADAAGFNPGLFSRRQRGRELEEIEAFISETVHSPPGLAESAQWPALPCLTLPFLPTGYPVSYRPRGRP